MKGVGDRLVPGWLVTGVGHLSLVGDRGWPQGLVQGSNTPKAGNKGAAWVAYIPVLGPSQVYNI